MNKYTAMKIVVVLALFTGATGLATDYFRLRTAPVTTVVNGDAGRGKQAISRYGCGSCHVIPGVSGANNHVGPPLTEWNKRAYIAGKLPNDPDNLIDWIQQPQSVWPGNVMPNLGVTNQDARDIAAYLYTLR